MKEKYKGFNKDARTVKALAEKHLSPEAIKAAEDRKQPTKDAMRASTAPMRILEKVRQREEREALETKQKYIAESGTLGPGDSRNAYVTYIAPDGVRRPIASFWSLSEAIRYAKEHNAELD